MKDLLKQRYKIAELIAKYLSGSATDAEEEILRKWIDEDPSHRNEYENILKRMRLDLLTNEPADPHSAWKQFSNKISTSSKTMLYLHHYIKYACAAAVFIAVFIASWQFLFPESQNHNVAIVPGTQRAILQIDSNTEVEIFPTSVINEANTPISLSNESGILRYDKLALKDSTHTINHTLTVPRGGEYAIILADGTKITLNSESQLTYPAAFLPTDTLREVYIKGEAYFNVAKNEKLPFKVHTSQGVIEVYGTRFNVHDYADEEQTLITLSEGSVGFISSNGGKYTLEPNQQIVCQHTTGNITTHQVDATLYCSWIDGIFEFNGMPLKQIMRQLSRWYNVNYQFSEPALEEHLFTGIAYRNIPLSELLKQIEKTTQIHFEIRENTIIISN